MDKRIIIICICLILFAAVAVAIAIGTTHKSDKDGGSEEVKNSTKLIKALCQPTDYVESCEKCLEPAQTNTSDPKELVKFQFQAAITELEKVIKESTNLKHMVKGKTMAGRALDNCEEHLGRSIDDLKSSINLNMSETDESKIDINTQNLRVWLGGAISYQETCLDGFNDTNCKECEEKMKERLKYSHDLTSNCLAMVNELGLLLKNQTGEDNEETTGSAASSRRLLSVDGFPSWAVVGSTRRQLLDDGHKSPFDIKPNVVVARDGSEKYRTINDALKKVPRDNGSGPFVIHIKAGDYKEQVIVTKEMKNVVFIGDGPTKTVISGSKNYADGVTTFKTATVGVIGEKFMAKDIGFENTAGHKKEKAVALRVESDESIFYNCRIDGHIGTLYAHSHRQFYRDCTISGTVIFIFGDAAALFQNCKIVVRKPTDDQKCIITSQGRTEYREVTAFIIQNCTITGGENYKHKAYLGSPQKEFSRTIIMQSQLDDIISPEGWLQRKDNSSLLENLVYAEFNNRGPGADQAGRVQWKGVKKFDEERAKTYTPVEFLQGDEWIVKSGVPYIPGMVQGL